MRYSPKAASQTILICLSIEEKTLICEKRILPDYEFSPIIEMNQFLWNFDLLQLCFKINRKLFTNIILIISLNDWISK